jgi:hypothetical protein
LLHFIRLLKWMIVAVGNFNGGQLATVHGLYSKLVPRQTQPPDLRVRRWTRRRQDLTASSS